ncbi:hypothetical protein XI06_22285 [Bradyrhizobium sp. CCBAU 11434]|nr:hypothetical protein [Bradyrhizobium sp. CCBAU 11434]
MLSTLKLPHWLMIAGGLLVIVGCLGMLLGGRKAEEVDAPEQPIESPKQMPALPKLLSSQKKARTSDQRR